MSREEAYAIVQRASLRAADERRPLKELLAIDPQVASHLTLTQLDACFDDAAFLRHVPGDHRPAGPPGPVGTDRRCRRLAPATGVHPVRQGPRPLRPRAGPDAARRERPHQRVRRGPADADPRQGPRAHGPVALLVRRDGRHRPEPPARDGPRRPPRRLGCRRPGARRPARPDDDRPAGRAPADRGDRPRLPVRHGLEGLPRDGRGLRHSGCRPAFARAIGCRSRCSRHRPRKRWARTTATSTSTRPPRCSEAERRGGASRNASASPPLPCIATAQPGRSRSGSSWPTRSSSSGSCPTAS